MRTSTSRSSCSCCLRLFVVSLRIRHQSQNAMLEVCYSISFHFLPLGRKIENTSRRRNFLHGPHGSQVTLPSKTCGLFPCVSINCGRSRKNFLQNGRAQNGIVEGGEASCWARLKTAINSHPKGVQFEVYLLGITESEFMIQKN